MSNVVTLDNYQLAHAVMRYVDHHKLCHPGESVRIDVTGVINFSMARVPGVAPDVSVISDVGDFVTMAEMIDMNALAARIEPIHGWWGAESGARLFQLIQATPGDVLELGAWAGRSTAWCAAALEVRDGEHGGGSVHSVDTWKGTTGEETHERLLEGGLNLFRVWEENLRRLGLFKRCSYTIDTTVRAHPGLANRRFGVLIIDADHSAEAVELDFQLYGDLVNVGGYLVLDDVPTWEGPTLLAAKVRSNPKWKMHDYWSNQAVFRRVG